MRRRKFLKISLFLSAVSLIPKAVFNSFGLKQYPRTVKELIAMLEAEFPSKLNSIDFNPDKQWEEYYKLNTVPELPTISTKIKYENPKQSKVKVLGTVRYDEQWKSDSLEIEREYIRKVYLQIKLDAKNLKASSVSWRLKPEINKLINLEKTEQKNSLYARAIFI